MNVPQPAPLKPLGGLGIVAAALIAVATVAAILPAIAAWNTVGAVNTFLAGPRTDQAGLDAADQLSLNGVYVLLGTIVAAAIGLIVWLWRARSNAERAQPAVQHRHRRGWVIGGWFCPVVNFWFPFQIVADVWRASRPNPQPGEVPHEVPMPLVRAWWAPCSATSCSVA